MSGDRGKHSKDVSSRVVNPYGSAWQQGGKGNSRAPVGGRTPDRKKGDKSAKSKGRRRSRSTSLSSSDSSPARRRNRASKIMMSASPGYREYKQKQEDTQMADAQLKQSQVLISALQGAGFMPKASKPEEPAKQIASGVDWLEEAKKAGWSPKTPPSGQRGASSGFPPPPPPQDPDSLTPAQVELLETIADVRLKDSSDEGATATVRKVLGIRKTSGAFDKWLKKRGVKAPRGLDERAKIIVATAKSL